MVHYGHTVETFLSNLGNADDAGDALGYVSAVAIEEKQAFDYNRGNPASDLCPSSQCPKLAPREKLYALYPNEGTLMADHPYVVLNWRNTDADHRQAALAFRDHLEGDAVQERFLLEGFRRPNGQPGVGVLPDPYFRSNVGLTLQPPDPAVLAEIRGSWSALRKRANLLIAIDVGQSMGDVVPDQKLSKLELAKRAAKEALTLLEDDDEVGLWTFSTRPEGDRPYREVLPISKLGDRSLLERRIDALEPESGKRQLFSTVLAGVEHVRSRLEPDRINAIVVLSDGTDEGSQVDFYDLISTLRRQPNDARVRVFTIAYGRLGSGSLRQIAEASPGAFYDAYPQTSPIKKVMRDVISNF